MKLTLNLASRTYVNRRALYTLYTVLLGALALVLVINLSYYIRLQGQSRQVKAHLAEVEAELESLKDGEGGKIRAEDFQRLEDQVAFANELLDKDSFRWTELLGRLEEVTIEGVSLRSIQPDYQTGSLNLRAAAKDVGILRDFLDSLIASPHFSYVYLLNQAEAEVKDNRGRERKAIDFSLLVKGAF
ncbi:PilN domain-containing protein [uncultured Desulfuromonas sp.]|uniref:PilN domain-containing protein n=1 Tax=uncultured Desulfuromonas sp. TaxID=181013 RepID=UPI0026331D91|nr:PilN domain-containing protein [uncultured Desulfuromonas sp.]